MMMMTMLQAQSDADFMLISRVVKSLVRDLQQELDDIIHLQSLSEQYQEQRTNLAPWLDVRPDTVDKLHAVMSSVAALKSKLRHRIADCQDLQEVS